MRADKKRMIQVGHWEGISYLLLLGLAMPLKYFAGWPMAVSVFGSLHGFLFVWFCLILFWMQLKKQITISKATLAVLLSLLPFGTFYLEKLVFRK
jgi:integral membrane protein